MSSFKLWFSYRFKCEKLRKLADEMRGQLRLKQPVEKLLEMLEEYLPEAQIITREQGIKLYNLESTVLVARNDNREWWDENLKPVGDVERK